MGQESSKGPAKQLWLQVSQVWLNWWLLGRAGWHLTWLSAGAGEQSTQALPAGQSLVVLELLTRQRASSRVSVSQEPQELHFCIHLCLNALVNLKGHLLHPAMREESENLEAMFLSVLH